jgi:phage/plasmid-like protein (TIGR03299 family)
MSANVDSMAYRGETPWHTLGNKLEDGKSIPQWRKAAGLAWDVIAAPVEYVIDGKRYTMEHKVLVRSDKPDVNFGTVGPIYTPWQNDEILEFFREYVEAGDMQLETAGALGRGEYVWALAKMEKDFNLGGKSKATADKVGGYVLVANPHKYGKGATIKFTPIRVVCQNTLTMALAGKGEGSITMPHRHSFNEGARAEAKERLGIAREQMDGFESDARKLAATKLNEEDVIEVLEIVFSDQERVAQRVKELYDGTGIGALLPSAQGTAWGLLNATTEYYDWHSGKQAETRLKSAWYGGGASKKRAMLDALLQRN